MSAILMLPLVLPIVPNLPASHPHYGNYALHPGRVSELGSSWVRMQVRRCGTAVVHDKKSSSSGF